MMFKRFKPVALIATTTAALVLLPVAPIMAAEPDTAQSTAPTASSYDDATLSQFADAYVQVASIGQTLNQDLQAAEDQTKAQEMQQQAQEEMVEVVQDAGLTVAEYNAIANEAQADPELRTRVDALIQERQ